MADDEEDEISRELSSPACPWPTYMAIDMIEIVFIDDDKRRQATTTATTVNVYVGTMTTTATSDGDDSEENMKVSMTKYDARRRQ